MSANASKWRSWTLLGVLLLAALLRLGIATRPIAAIDGKSLPDDTYISLELARQIGQGNGPRFGDQMTNGFQPLYVFLMAPAFAGYDAPALSDTVVLDRITNLALILLALFDLASMGLWVCILRRRFGDHPAVFLAMLWWAVHPTVLTTAANGLETAIAVFFLLWIWERQQRVPFPVTSSGSLLLSGVIVGLGATARIDLLLLGVFFAAASLQTLWRKTLEPMPWFKRNMAFGLGVAAAYLPWVVYSYGHTGMVFPVSGSAIRFMSMAYYDHTLSVEALIHMPLVGLLKVMTNTPFLVLILVGYGVARLLGRVDAPQGWRRGDLALPVVFGITLFASYTLYVLGPWFFHRYLFPLSVPLLALSVPVWVRISASLEQRFGSGPHFAMAALILGLSLSTATFQSLVWGKADPDLGYRNLGLWAGRHFDAGTTVGSSQTGALAYYAPQLDVVNLDGVVSREALQSLRERTHFEYIRERGLDYVLGWEININFIRVHSSQLEDGDLVHEGTIPGFRSWNNPWEIYRVAPASR